MTAKLEEGRPFWRELEALRTVFAGDEFVHTFANAIPREVAERGALTHAQLQGWLAELEPAAARVALLPPEGGGIMSYALSHLAAMLRVREVGETNASATSSATSSVITNEGGGGGRGASEGDGEGGSVESKLLRVRKLMADGLLYECAEALQEGFEGTAAEGLVRDWVEAARARGQVEQALHVLQSYALAKAASCK